VTASVIVVNFNGGESVVECLESIQRSIDAGETKADIIVVDNASTDGSRDFVRDFAATHSALAILNDRNIGYAAAINQASERARGDYLAVCNMDITVTPGWLDALVDWLRSHPKTGAVNPLLLLPDGRVNACGQNIHITALGFNRLLGSSTADVPGEPFEVSGIQGAVFALPRATLNLIGGMDQDGFLYHEDVDLSWRLRLAGFDLYCIPAARANHDYVLSMDPLKFHLLERNRLAMLAACLELRTALLLSVPLLFSELLAWMYACLRGVRFMAAKFRSYVWVWRRRLEIRKRREMIQATRKRSDWQILRRLHWNYDWRQFASLARESGTRRSKSATAAMSAISGR
jgi:GT2 family glycosyltransferase